MDSGIFRSWACLPGILNHGNRFWPERTSNKIQMVLRIIDYSYLDNYGNTYINYWKNNICKISWKRYFINSCIQHTVQLSIRQCKYLKKTYIAGLHLFFLLILITALFIFTVWLQDTEKKIPVTYSGKLQGKSTFKGVSTNTIPIKLCPGGVVPIIFASSLISFPILIAQIAGAKQNAVLKLLNSGYWFNTSKPWYTFGALIYLVLIFAFSYFYTEITMNPEEIANNIKKSGGNIAGIRAGSSTAEYLRKQMKYLIAIGSFCLCIIAIIPFIVSGLTGLSRLSFFGTSIIITVSVILETKKLILSKTQENYYMNRVKKGGLFRG